MTRPTRPGGHIFNKRAAVTTVLLLAISLYGCSNGSASTKNAGAVPSLPTPLATSVQTADGVWATLPMGHLGDPANTFWQLLFRPVGAASWSNDVEAAATATNGGLVLASPGDRRLIVAVRPSADLTYTPLIATDNAARSWSDGLITSGLTARPAALAAGGDGQALALVGARGGSHVLTSSGDLSSWRLLTTQSALGGAGRSCALGALTAVGFLAGQALVGGSCAASGVVGLFVQRRGAWHLTGPALPSTLASGRVEIMALGTTKGGSSALLGISDGHEGNLVVAWSAGAARWTASPPLRLSAGEKVISFGPASEARPFVLLQTASGQDALVLSEGSQGWRRLAPPPGGTATIAFAGATADALAAQGTLLTIWSLRPGLDRWSKSQVVKVPLQYGSSS